MLQSEAVLARNKQAAVLLWLAVAFFAVQSSSSSSSLCTHNALQHPQIKGHMRLRPERPVSASGRRTIMIIRRVFPWQSKPDGRDRNRDEPSDKLERLLSSGQRQRSSSPTPPSSPDGAANMRNASDISSKTRQEMEALRAELDLLKARCCQREIRVMG